MKRFDEKDGFVIDHKTGLEWQSKVSGPMSWNEAMKLPESLGYGWRLPTVEELHDLVDRSKSDPASSFPGMQSRWFWSSSSFAGSSSRAWYVSFYDGYVYSNDKSNTNYVRCVRLGEWLFFRVCRQLQRRLSLLLRKD